jgi:hypothetical protein
LLQSGVLAKSSFLLKPEAVRFKEVPARSYRIQVQMEMPKLLDLSNLKKRTSPINDTFELWITGLETSTQIRQKQTILQAI